MEKILKLILLNKTGREKTVVETEHHTQLDVLLAIAHVLFSWEHHFKFSSMFSKASLKYAAQQLPHLWNNHKLKIRDI